MESGTSANSNPVELGKAAAWIYLLLWFAALALATTTQIGGARIAAADFRYPLQTWHWIWLACWGLVPLLLIVAAAILLRARPRDPFAALLSLSLLLFSATELMGGTFLLRMNLAAVPIVLGNLARFGFILALLLFPTGRFAWRWGKVTAAAAGAYLALAAWQAHHVLAHAAPETCRGDPACARVPHHVVLDDYSALMDAIVVGGLISLCAFALGRRMAATDPGLKRQQLRWVLAGIVLFLLCYAAWIVLNVFPGASGFVAPAYWAPLGGLVYGAAFILLAAGFLIAMMRYRLYDADTVLSRSAAYSILAAGAGVLYLAGEFGLNRLLANAVADDASRRVSVAILALVIVTPLKTAATDWADSRLRKPLANLKTSFPQCLNELREAGSLSGLLRETARWIAAASGASRLAFLVDGRVAFASGASEEATGQWLAAATLDPEAGGLQCLSRDEIFPLRLPLRTGDEGPNALAGYLLLGPRPDGSLPGKEEREAVAALAPALARAIRAVQRRERHDAGIEAMLTALAEGRPSRP